MIVDVVSDASTETVLYADVPIKVQQKITYTEPGLKGDTATNTLKPATVESGATVRVPLFINEGETIEIARRFLRKPRKSISPFGNQANALFISSPVLHLASGDFSFHLFICKA